MQCIGLFQFFLQDNQDEADVQKTFSAEPEASASLRNSQSMTNGNLSHLK